MSKVIFITTSYPGLGDEPHKIIWETAKACSQQTKLKEEEEKYIILQIDEGRIAVIENEGNIQRDEEKAQILNQSFNFLRTRGIKIEEVYYATHMEYSKLEKHLESEIKSTYHCSFGHTEGTEPFETINKVVELIKKSNSDAARKFDNLCEIIKKKSDNP